MSLFERPATWPEMGLMRGAPPPPERLVTSDNWIEGPFNRWGFLHVRELARTARISRGRGPVSELPADPQPLDDVAVTFENTTVRFADALEHTYTDAICIVRDGHVVFERYVDGMAPDDVHLLMSVSKSPTATLIGALTGEGVLAPNDRVTNHRHPPHGTAAAG